MSNPPATPVKHTAGWYVLVFSFIGLPLLGAVIMIKGCDSSSNDQVGTSARTSNQVGTTATTVDNAILCETQASLPYVREYTNVTNTRDKAQAMQNALQSGCTMSDNNLTVTVTSSPGAGEVQVSTTGAGLDAPNGNRAWTLTSMLQ